MSKITEYERNHAKKYEKQCNDRRRNEENMVAEREEVQLTEEREDVQYNKQRKRNEMEIVFDAVSCNESFARVAVAAFITHLNPTLEELDDIKTAVSEAVTNAVIHGYRGQEGKIYLSATAWEKERLFSVTVRDEGVGIRDVEQAMEPMFTTCPEDGRSGMGFSFMEAFMDRVEVVSAPGKGTSVTMKKKIGR